jgi:hypothetical protein
VRARVCVCVCGGGEGCGEDTVWPDNCDAGTHAQAVGLLMTRCTPCMCQCVCARVCVCPRAGQGAVPAALRARRRRGRRAQRHQQLRYLQARLGRALLAACAQPSGRVSQPHESLATPLCPSPPPHTHAHRPLNKAATCRASTRGSARTWRRPSRASSASWRLTPTRTARTSCASWARTWHSSAS